QGNISINQPANPGPMAGANEITNPAIPIANPRFSKGKININIVIINGINTPAPIAWIIRPTIKNEKLGVIKQTNVPTINVPIEKRKSLLVEKVSIKNAVIGIIIPFTSIKIVVTHCPIFSVKSNSFIIYGVAVINKVWFKIAKKDPINNTATIGPLLFGDSFFSMYSPISLPPLYTKNSV